MNVMEHKTKKEMDDERRMRRVPRAHSGLSMHSDEIHSSSADSLWVIRLHNQRQESLLLFKPEKS